MLCGSLQVLRQAVGLAAGRAVRAPRSAQTVCAAADGRRRQRKSAAKGSGGSGGSGAPPGSRGAAFTAAQWNGTASAAAGPLHDRWMLADKLTATAKNIEWTDLPVDRPAEATRAEIDVLQQTLKYQFSNRYLLRLALIHPSAAPSTHNGVMAWIGDACLYLIVAEEVSAALGYIPIGKLTEVRKTLIGRLMCEKYANHLNLGPYLVLGKSVRTQNAGQPSTNMLAEMFEAVMGAIYLDGGLDAVRSCYTSHFPLPPDPLSLLQPDGTGGIPSSSSSSSPPAEPSPWE